MALSIYQGFEARYNARDTFSITSENMKLSSEALLVEKQHIVLYQIEFEHREKPLPNLLQFRLMRLPMKKKRVS